MERGEWEKGDREREKKAGEQVEVPEKRKVNEEGGKGEREIETETKKQEGKAKSFLIFTRGIKKDTELNIFIKY